jgi:hypothetical protein
MIISALEIEAISATANDWCLVREIGSGLAPLIPRGLGVGVVVEFPTWPEVSGIRKLISVS